MFFFTALVFPLALRLNMDMANVLGMSFWMYFLFGITALPWGMAADRWSAKFLLILFYFGSGLSALAAAIWIESSTGFFVSLALLGLFSGIYHPAGLGLISKEIKRVGLGMGYNGMFGNLGIAMSPLLAGIFNWLWGLRIAYLIMGIMSIIRKQTNKGFPHSACSHDAGRNYIQRINNNTSCIF
jgi:MFS family permease